MLLLWLRDRDRLPPWIEPTDERRAEDSLELRPLLDSVVSPVGWNGRRRRSGVTVDMTTGFIRGVLVFEEGAPRSMAPTRIFKVLLLDMFPLFL